MFIRRLLPPIWLSISLRRRRRLQRWFLLLVIILFLYLMLLMAAVAGKILAPVTELALSGVNRLVVGSNPNVFWKFVLSQGLGPQAPVVEQHPAPLPVTLLKNVTGIDPGRPETLINTEVTLFNVLQRSVMAGAAELPLVHEEGEFEAPDEVGPPPKMPEGIGQAVVALYTTHNAEDYPTGGRQLRLEGQNAGVAEVAYEMQQELERGGIPVARSETINDYPDWNRSYINSAQTAHQLIAANNRLQLILDIHRDVLPNRKNSVVKINGQEVARVLIIVGTNDRLPHPNWRLNWDMANRLNEIMEEMYPGLSRGVRAQKGRYNQHLHPGALLIEVGSDRNSRNEALRAAPYLARAIGKLVTTAPVKATAERAK